jgi:hypothetical protein
MLVLTTAHTKSSKIEQALFACVRYIGRDEAEETEPKRQSV